jgi:surface protein
MYAMFRYASVFNQPLSWDTSRVTNMAYMFYVRSARALAPKPYVESSRVRAACAATTPRPPAPRPASHALPSTLGSPRGFSTSR